MKRRTPAEIAKQAERLLSRYSAHWMATEGVVACGIGLKNQRDPSSVVIKIYVRQLGLPPLRRLPRTVDGIPVVIEEGGEIKALKERKQ